jgi:hypothetical protein
MDWGKMWCPSPQTQTMEMFSINKCWEIICAEMALKFKSQTLEKGRGNLSAEMNID